MQAFASLAAAAAKLKLTTTLLLASFTTEMQALQCNPSVVVEQAHHCSDYVLDTGATSQCKSIAKKYKFTGPDFKPASLCAPRTPLPKDHGSMYLTITPDCRVMVETVNINQAGERRVIQQGTHELFLGIAEVPCFGVHWSYPWSGIVGDQFYEIDSHGEMRNYMTGSTCSHNCLPSECVLHWKTDAWPDCSWAMKSHQVQSAIKEVPGE
jgi:hypothetical protein